MNLLAALTYAAIIALWLGVLATLVASYHRDPRAFGVTKLLLAVLLIDTFRNIVENIYFGVYFGAQFGVFPDALVAILGQPRILIIPKLINVGAACAVLGLLVLRWLPMASEERHRVERELHQAEWRFRLLVDGVTDYAIYLLDPEGRVTSWNSGAERIKGYTEAEVIGTNVARFYSDDQRLAGAPEQALAIAEREGRYKKEEWRLRKDGTKFWGNVVTDAIRDDRGKLIGFAMVTQDISARKLAQEQLAQLAHYDQLTGLPNRAALRKDLQARVEQVTATQSGTASIAVLDLDGFKEINDTLGHSIGDKLLQLVTERLLRALDGSAAMYRMGGDEFVLVFADRGDVSAAQVVHSVLTRLTDSFEVEGHRLFVAASAGIATAPIDGSNVEALMSNADLALYEAKAAGGRTHRLYLPALRANAEARRDLKAELRRAISDGEFILYFQPQLRLADGLVVGAEALLRWGHPDRGILGPAEFIEALAQSPSVHDAGRWILQSACKSAAEWRAMGLPPIQIGVNLFPAQFQDGSLKDVVEAALAKSQLSAEALELEITENIPLGREEKILPQLQALREIGTNLAFDDFGTGYASLSYLTRYPLTRIKIDQSFVKTISGTSTPRELAILRATITMAHSLGLNVIAEGVETEAQASFLHSEGCEEAQGFLYAKPLSDQDFQEFVRHNHGVPKGRTTGSRAPELILGTPG